MQWCELGGCVRGIVCITIIVLIGRVVTKNNIKGEGWEERDKVKVKIITLG